MTIVEVRTIQDQDIQQITTDQIKRIQKNVGNSGITYKCPRCKDQGWVGYRGEDGYFYARECECGIVSKKKMAGMLAFASIPDRYRTLVMADFDTKWYGNDQVTIKKVSSNVYNFNVFYSGSNVTGTTRFILKEGRFFEAPTSIPDRQLRYDMGRNYQAGFQVHFDYTFSKTYPSEEMYYRAKEEEHRVAIENNTPKQWSGTGFALNDGYIVTNYHVIDGAKSISIQGVKGNFDTHYAVTIVGCDKNNDLALLKISDSNFTGFGPIPYAISNTTSEVGEDVFVLGYPLTSTMGDEIKLTTGIISSRTGFQGDVALYQISAPIQPGNSGGPLFDKKGNVIGIVSAKHSGAENVGYAIKTMYLRNLVESCANASIIPTNNTISTLALTGKVKKEKSFVFFINCSK